MMLLRDFKEEEVYIKFYLFEQNSLDLFGLVRS